MSRMDYSSFYAGFSPDSLQETVLQGSWHSGLNVCAEVCDRWAAQPDKVALYHRDLEGQASQMTFLQLSQQASRFANYLKSMGVGKGDRVAGLLPRTPELLVVILGTLKAGAVYQPLFTAFGSGAIEYRLQQAATRLIVTDATNFPKLQEVKACPAVLCVQPLEGQAAADFDKVLAVESSDFEAVMISGDDPFLQMFTSGTVGKSKGVAVPARALLSFYIYMKYAIDLQPEDTYWNVADPGWAYGLYYAVIGPLLLGHATHFNQQGFTPETTYQMIHQFAITNLAAAPTAYRLLMAHDGVLPEDESLGLRVASSAGEPLNPEVINWVARRLGCPVMDHYGQTETGMTCCNFHTLKHPERIGSMGYSMPGHRVVALDDAFNEVAEGETGQLAVDLQQSPLFFFDGYTWAEKHPFAGQYYLTGDMVFCHGDGGYSFTGRDDDIITTAGYRVGPADIESTLLEHPSVAESGVVGKPDDERGSIIKAFVVIKSGFDPLDSLKDELQALVRKRLSAHAFPREIEFVDELPKTPSGKIQRFVLRQLASGLSPG
ncbi:AMP-binding protein [Nitrincola iocasae]|uniref:AMP-binding protein n=1 Tax=Nitrincola iocasae TaxID=2614693 RepID=A0A5J6LD33_9GAMM|nr:AMP-binding protein [Nitrincola iocasae]QEW06430.1 AMP-binding protein [Nitrincola iocasae]